MSLRELHSHYTGILPFRVPDAIITLPNGRNPNGTCVNGSHVKHCGTLCRMGVTHVELRFTPEMAVRIGTALIVNVNRDMFDHVENELFSSEKITFLYAQGIWTYRQNSDGSHTFDVGQFTNIANFSSVAYEIITNSVGDYYEYAKVWRSVIADVTSIHIDHMFGEATGALFINFDTAHGLVSSFRMKNKINRDAEEYHSSMKLRDTLLGRTAQYGLELINDNDAMEAELEMLKSLRAVLSE